MKQDRPIILTISWITYHIKIYLPMKYYLIIFSALMLMACGRKKETEEPIRPVFYQKIEKQSVKDIRSFGGISQSDNEAKLSFRVGGSIEKINVELGDWLKKGQPIARLDNTDYEINYNKVVMAQNNAKAQLIAAKSAFQRVENLYMNNYVSLNDFENAKVKYESASLMAKTADAQVEAAKNQLEYTLLSAPYDGTVTSLLADESEMVGGGHPIALFSSSSNMEVRTAVPENVIGKLTKGQQVTVTFSALPNELFNGVISEMSSGTSRSSIYTVIIRLTDVSDKLLSGMTGTVNIPLMTDGENEKTVIVSTDAVGHDDQGDFVFLARKSETEGVYLVTRQKVVTGDLNPMGYPVIEGLSPDDIVLIAGLNSLYEGQKVKLLDDQK